MRNSLGWVLILSMLSGSFAYGADVPPTPTPGGRPVIIETTPLPAPAAAPQKFTPIGLMQSGPDRKPTEDYYHDGLRLENAQQYKDVMGPLNDAETNRLVANYMDLDTVGTILDISGGVLAVGGAAYGFLASETSKTTPNGLGGVMVEDKIPDQAPAWILGGCGAAAVLAGLLLQEQAGQSRRDAVKRYDHLIGADQSFSFVPLLHSGLASLVFTQRF